VPQQRDDRSPFVLALEWTSRITTIALEMVLPCLVGFWLDRRLGTWVLFAVLGAIAGFAAGMWHLIQLARVSRVKHNGGGSRDERE
jgi:ATP synthase protein I